jgi:hypothetical protein
MTTPAAGLRDGDEHLHRPPDPMPANWQENLFVILWDTQRQDGFMMHVQRVPGRGVQEARIVAGIGGAVASATVTGPYHAEALVDGVAIEVLQPFRQLRVRTAFAGAPGRGPLGFVAGYPAGPVPVLVDAELVSDLPAVDFAGPLAALTARLRSDDRAPQMGDQAHYEQGGTWAGTISIGDQRVEGAGLFVRDHSWGERHEHNDFRAFWTATCLDGGRVFANAIGMPTPAGVVGVGAVADERGVRFTEDVAATFSPAPGLASYDRSEVRYGAGIDLVVQGETQQHWPLQLPFSGANRYDNNAMSAVTAGPLAGFAVMEWATTLAPEQTALLDQAAGATALSADR